MLKYSLIEPTNMTRMSFRNPQKFITICNFITKHVAISISQCNKALNSFRSSLTKSKMFTYKTSKIQIFMLVTRVFLLDCTYILNRVYAACIYHKVGFYLKRFVIIKEEISI